MLGYILSLRKLIVVCVNENFFVIDSQHDSVCCVHNKKRFMSPGMCTLVSKRVASQTVVEMITMIAFLVVYLTISLSSQQQECQNGKFKCTAVALVVLTGWHVGVSSGIREARDTVAPVAYSGTEPDTTGCVVRHDGEFLDCGAGEGVLSDGDIGPTDSVDVSDPDQVTRFFVWHRDNGLVGLFFTASDVSSVSYIDVYFLSLPSASIRPPETTVIATDLSPMEEDTVAPQSTCSFFSTTNGLTRNTFTLSQNPDDLIITFNFNQNTTDWMFISEILLCAGDPPSSISCDSPTTDPTPTTSPRLLWRGGREPHSPVLCSTLLCLHKGH